MEATMSPSLARLTALAAALAIGAAGAASAKTLKYSDHDPLGGMRTNFVKEVWLPEIEKQSNGAFKIQDFWGGALMGSKEALKGVGDGVVDMTFIFPGHYPGQLPAHQIFDVFPRGPESFDDMAKLYRRVYAEVPAFSEELKRAGAMTVMSTAGLPGAFVGKKPLKSLADVKGDKWRAGGKWKLKFLENAGAIPVAVPWGDVYVALQTGTIDGCFTNYDGLHMMKFDEVAQNLLISKALWYATPFIHLVGVKMYDGLSKAERDAIEKASLVAEEKFSPVYDAAFDQVRKAQLAAGYTVTEMSEADVIAWENAEKLEAMRAEWIVEAEKAGLKNAAQVMEQVKAIHAEIVGK
jgi:TRAP-type C4-dicarboxylate transport system substrate-binding protein